MTIYHGILTAYPNFIFRIDEKDVDEFAASFVDADTPEKFTAVVERWGVRRSSPDFWEVVRLRAAEKSVGSCRLRRESA